MTEKQKEAMVLKIRQWSNSGQYRKAYKLSWKLHREHPKDFQFAYLAAVFHAEDPRGLKPSEVKKRYATTARNLKALLRRLRGVPDRWAYGARNEYYWFSKQPLKQYRLGVEGVAKGNKRAYYSQGVGSCELAYKYALQGRWRLCERWARKSKKAWENFFKVDSKWYNAYLFYGKVLGLLGKPEEMERSFKIGSRISGMPVNDETFEIFRREVSLALKKRAPRGR